MKTNRIPKWAALTLASVMLLAGMAGARAAIIHNTGRKETSRSGQMMARVAPRIRVAEPNGPQVRCCQKPDNSKKQVKVPLGPVNTEREVGNLVIEKKKLQEQGGRAEEIRKLNLRLIESCDNIKRIHPSKTPSRDPVYASLLVTLAEAYLETGDLALARLNANAALPIVDKCAFLYRSGALGYRGDTAEQALERMVTKRKDQMLPRLIEVYKKLIQKAPGDMVLAKNLKAAEEIMRK